MTLARHSASPAVSGIDGAVSPGVQAGLPRTSPSKVGASDFDCGVSDAQNLRALKEAGNGFQSASRLNSRKGALLPASAPRPEKSCPQSSICPELTAYITVLLSVVGAIAWAHVFSMDLKLANQLINFHPKAVFCDAVGTKADFVCAVRHKEGE